MARTEPRNAHIIRVDDFWNERSEEEGTSRTYIKMERCDGTLAEYLIRIREKGEEIHPKELIEIMLHILSGLKHCHDRKVCHRDLKLTNSICPSALLLLTQLVLHIEGSCVCHPLQQHGKRWVLTDFGFSTILESKSIIQSRHGRGTDAYRAPELIENAVEGRSSAGIVSRYADIWALGCILFKLATTGRSSAFTSDWTAIAYKQNHGGFELPQLNSSNGPFSILKPNSDWLRVELNLVLRACFAREPKERPTCDQLLEKFEMLNELMKSLVQEEE